MLKQGLFSLLVAALGILNAQSVIKGVVKDEISGELIDGAKVTAKSVSALTDRLGRFTLKVPMGEYFVSVEVEGFAPDTQFVQADRNLITDINFNLENLSASIQAVQIVASVAKDRKTPIAYSNISGKEIQERLGSQDMPVLLNNTPGVYEENSSKVNSTGFTVGFGYTFYFNGKKSSSPWLDNE